MAETRVVLVDPHDSETGTAPKLQAHRDGLLHRAVSVFVADRAGRMLLQRRAAGKYHSGGLWSNTTCTHPRPGENPHQAANRRLREEMGIEADLEHVFAVIYHLDVGGGLVEHEFDHVYRGVADADPRPDPAEVMEWRWVEPGELRRELEVDPDRFTAWFRLVAPRLMDARTPES
jgi:isopentenyl-diphosphate delta-isomerase